MGQLQARGESLQRVLQENEHASQAYVVCMRRWSNAQRDGAHHINLMPCFHHRALLTLPQAARESEASATVLRDQLSDSRRSVATLEHQVSLARSQLKQQTSETEAAARVAEKASIALRQKMDTQVKTLPVCSYSVALSHHQF